LVAIVLGVIGAILSYLLLEHHVEIKSGIDVTSSYCNLSAQVNCDTAARSPWSELFGVSIASIGLAFYLMLAIVGLVSLDTRQFPQRPFRDGLLIVALAASLVSIFLLFVSLVLLKSICPLCFGTYLVNFLLFGAALWAGLGTPISSRLKEGFASALQLPLIVLGLRSPEGIRSGLIARGLSIIAVTIFVGAILLEGYLFASLNRPDPGAGDSLRSQISVQSWLAKPSVDLEITVRGATDSDYAKGSSGAPVRVVQFSDFECPMCRRFHETMEQILAKYPDQIQYVHKDFPLDQSCNPAIERKMHESACFAANLTRCAGEQGKFWELVRAIYTLPAIDQGEGAEVVVQQAYQRAEVLGLDSEALRECVESKRQQGKILDDIRLGNALQIPGTPAVYINGRMVQQLSFESIDAIISYIVSGKAP
jgi:protein-disulfide isomerase/uncharacterized membrane protein